MVLMFWTHIHDIFGEMSWPSDKFMDVYGGRIGMDRNQMTKMTKGPLKKKLMNIQNACTVRSVAYSRRPREKFGRREGIAVNFEQLIECIHFFVTGFTLDLQGLSGFSWHVLFAFVSSNISEYSESSCSGLKLFNHGDVFGHGTLFRQYQKRTPWTTWATTRRWDGRERYTKAIS